MSFINDPESDRQEAARDLKNLDSLDNKSYYRELVRDPNVFTRQQTLGWMIGGTVTLLGLGLPMLLTHGIQLGARICGAIFTCLGIGVFSVWFAHKYPRPPAPHTEVDYGRSVTVLRRSTAPFWIGFVCLQSMGVGVLSIAIYGLVYREYTYTIICLPIILWLVGLAVVCISGRYIAGGVWLAPDGIAYRTFGRQYSLAWDQIESVLALGHHVDVFPTEGIVPKHVKRAGRFYGGINRSRRRQIIIGLDGQSVDDLELEAILKFYWRNPRRRAELGTSLSLDRIEEIRQSVVRP